MNTKKILFAAIGAFAICLAPVVSSAAILYTQTIPLEPGWNSISTPLVVSSHAFSATENSLNFDVLILDGSQTTGWATMAQEGQSEFTPLYGYFINNKTGSNKTLTFNYLASTTPAQRLLERRFNTTGWYSIGVSTPTYALGITYATSTDINNPSSILAGLNNGYDNVVDFTHGNAAINIRSAAVASSWRAVTQTDINTLNDLRETKGYAVHVTVASSSYSGYQNDVATATPNASFAITVSASPAAQNVSPGASSFTFANLVFDATASADDILLRSVPLSFAGNNADLTGCQLFDASTALTTGGNVQNSLTQVAANFFSLDNPLTLLHGTAKTLAVKCNISGGSVNGHTFRFGINSSYNYTATSSYSIAVTPTVVSATSSLMTVAAGALAVATDASSPSYALAAGGTSGITVGVLKFTATNESQTLTSIGFMGSTSIDANTTQLSVWNGATQVGTATFTGGSIYATSTLSTPVNLPQDTDVMLTIKVNAASVGSGQPGIGGSYISPSYSAAIATGNSSGGTINSTGSSSFAGVRLERSYPTTALIGLSSTGVADGRLLRFSVTANPGGAVGVEQFSFTIATSTFTAGGGVSNMFVYGFTDSGFTTPVAGAAGGQLNSTGIAASSTVRVTTNNLSAGVLQVPAGTSYYFELRGTVTGSQSGTAVVTTLLGDSVYVRAATSTINGSRNFTWSPNSTSTSGFTSNDFTDGFGVPGLPSSGLVQTRTN